MRYQQRRLNSLNLTQQDWIHRLYLAAMQSNTNPQRHEGLQSIPWGSASQQAPPSRKPEYYISEKPIAPTREGKRICGMKKSLFILFISLGIVAVAITIIAAVVSADRRRPSRYIDPLWTRKIRTNQYWHSNIRVEQQGADRYPESSTSTSPSRTSFRPAATPIAPSVVLLSLDCSENNTASIFKPDDKGGLTQAFGFTASCGLDCAASNFFTFVNYNMELCATTCAGKTGSQCGAMVFSYDGATSNSGSKKGNCLLTTGCVPR